MRCSADSLLGEIRLVFVGDADVSETLKLLGLDALHLEALVLDLLADFSTLLEIVEALLLPAFGVNTNLVPITSKHRGKKRLRPIISMDAT